MARDGSVKSVLLSLAASAFGAAASLWAAAATGASVLLALGFLFLAAAGSQALIVIALVICREADASALRSCWVPLNQSAPAMRPSAS